MANSDQLSTNIQCLYYLCGLSPDEQKRFELYLQSDYHTKSVVIRDAYQALYRMVLNVEDESRWPSKEELWGAVFQDRPFSPNRLNKIFYDLKTELFLFFQIEQVKQQDVQKVDFPFETLNDRGLNRHLGRELENRIKEVRKERAGLEKTHKLYELEQLEYKLHLNPYSRKKAGKLPSLFQICEEHITLLGLRMALYDLDRSKAYRDFSLPNNLLPYVDYLQSHATRFPPLIQVYLQTFTFLALPHQRNTLKTLIETLSSPHSELDKECMAELIGFCLNECIRLGNQGQHWQDQETLSIYRLALDNGYILDHNGLCPFHHFNNIITLLCRTGKPEEARLFIQNYKNKVSGQEQGIAEQAELYGKGLIYLLSGNFLKAIRSMEVLRKKNADTFLMLNSHLVTVKAAWEMDSIEEEFDFEKKLEAYRMYVGRAESLTDKRRASHEKFIACCKKLVRVRRKENKFFARNMEKLKEMVKEGEGYAYSVWIKEKIAEIETK